MPNLLHIRLKVGNELLVRLKEAALIVNKEKELQQVLSQLGLHKDRGSDRKVYNIFNGNDVKKFRFFYIFFLNTQY